MPFLFRFQGVSACTLRVRTLSGGKWNGGTVPKLNGISEKKRSITLQFRCLLGCATNEKKLLQEPRKEIFLSFRFFMF